MTVEEQPVWKAMKATKCLSNFVVSLLVAIVKSEIHALASLFPDRQQQEQPVKTQLWQSKKFCPWAESKSYPPLYPQMEPHVLGVCL